MALVGGKSRQEVIDDDFCTSFSFQASQSFVHGGYMFYIPVDDRRFLCLFVVFVHVTVHFSFAIGRYMLLYIYGSLHYMREMPFSTASSIVQI